MPTYDYQCETCGKAFEYFQSMSDDPLSECQECNGSLKRLIGGGMGLIFKGSGFYVTDNKSKNGSKTDSASSESDKSGKTESAPVKKTESKKETVKSST